MTSTDELHDHRTGQHLTFQPSAPCDDGSRLDVEVRLDPGGRVPTHAHLRQDERLTLIAGSIHVRIGQLERTLQPGDAIDVPRRVRHTVRNAGDTEAHFLLQVRPARRMQAALRALFAISTRLAPTSPVRSGGDRTPSNRSGSPDNRRGFAAGSGGSAHQGRLGTLLERYEEANPVPGGGLGIGIDGVFG